MTETPKSLTGKWIVNWVTRGPQKTKWGEGPRFMWGGREVTLCCRYAPLCAILLRQNIYTTQQK